MTYEFVQNRIEELCSPDFIIPEDSFYSVTDCFESAYVFDIITKVTSILCLISMIIIDILNSCEMLDLKKKYYLLF